MNNVALDNGDQVGVACPWAWPELFDGISTRHLIAVQKAVHAGEWLVAAQSKDKWVGIAVARALDYDIKTSRQRINALISEWIENEALKVVERLDLNRDMRKFVEVGKWATP